MTTMLDRLRREAREGATGNGHLMKRYRRREFWGTPYAECARCGATVDVCDNPAPNQTNISGDAVATFCRGEAVAGNGSRTRQAGYRPENGRGRVQRDSSEKEAA